MTYNEWRDELKNNLLSVSDAERRRVLDYYAEAYADRREAGFTEREIIADFGAPYDAAQRILCENDDFAYAEPPKNTRFGDRRRSEPEPDFRYEPQPQPQGGAATIKKREDNTWLFVLLCVIFAIPIFCLVMTMVGVTITLWILPFSVVTSGVGRLVVGSVSVFTDVVGGFMRIGAGLIQLGVGMVLFPVCKWLVQIMWKLFSKFFRWFKSLFSGKEVA